LKVTKVGINRKPVCDFLLVININLHPISYRFEVTADYCSNLRLFAFLSHPLGSLAATYTVHLRFIGKPVVDFLFVLTKLFSLGVTAEALRAKMDRKSAFCKQVGELRPNFCVEGNVSHQSFLQWQTFFKRSAILHRKRPFCVFEPPLGD